jgi:hypothetical protein
MPVYKLVDEMPYTEFLGWLAYFEKRPYGWQDDDRTYKLMRVQGCEAKPESIFHSLALMNQKPTVKDGMISVANLKQSFLFNKILSAEGGEKLDI